MYNVQCTCIREYGDGMEKKHIPVSIHTFLFISSVFMTTNTF